MILIGLYCLRRLAIKHFDSSNPLRGFFRVGEPQSFSLFSLKIFPMWKVFLICPLFFISSCIPRMYVSDFEDRPCKINPLHLKELRFEGAYYQIDKNNKLDVYFFYNNCIQRSIAIDSNHYNSSSIAQSIQKIIDDFNVASRKFRAERNQRTRTV